jgi:hypothetical protein
MRVYQPIWELIQRNYKPVAKTPWWGGHTLYVYVRRDVLDRSADPKRLKRWSEDAPGLQFDHARILDEM